MAFDEDRVRGIADRVAASSGLEVVEIEFEDREAAMAFIRKNQLGRRNMPPEAMSYIRGQHYNAEKNTHGGDRKGETSGKESRLKTDAALAERGFQRADDWTQLDGTSQVWGTDVYRSTAT